MREPEETPLDLSAGWATLPPELQAAVVAKLPLKERAAARLVSHDWNNWLHSPLHWKDVRRLTLCLESCKTQEDHLLLCMDNLAKAADLEGDAALHQNPVNFKGQQSAELVERTRSVLAFLAPRCPLLNLEFYSCDYCLVDIGPLLVAAATTGLRLQALAVDVSLPFSVPEALGALVRSQPELGTLVLGSYLYLAPQDLVTLGGALEQAEHLRVLVLSLESVAGLWDLPARLLQRLDCLSISYDYDAQGRQGMEDQAAVTAAVKAAAAGQYRHVAELAPDLLLRQHDVNDVLGLARSRIFWAKEGFEWDKATKDEALYSGDFLGNWHYLG